MDTPKNSLSFSRHFCKSLHALQVPNGRPLKTKVFRDPKVVLHTKGHPLFFFIFVCFFLALPQSYLFAATQKESLKLGQTWTSSETGTTAFSFSSEKISFLSKLTEQKNETSLKAISGCLKITPNLYFFAGCLSVSGLASLAETPQFSLSKSIFSQGLATNPAVPKNSSSGSLEKASFLYQGKTSSFAAYIETEPGIPCKVWALAHKRFFLPRSLVSLSFLTESITRQTIVQNSWFISQISPSLVRELRPAGSISFTNDFFSFSLILFSFFRPDFLPSGAYRFESTFTTKSLKIEAGLYSQSAQFIPSSGKNKETPFQGTLSIDFLLYQSKKNKLKTGFTGNLLFEKKRELWYEPYRFFFEHESGVFLSYENLTIQVKATSSDNLINYKGSLAAKSIADGFLDLRFSYQKNGLESEAKLKANISILQLTMGCEASSFFYADTKEYKTCLAPEIGLSIKTKKFKGSINANAIIKEAEKKSSWKLSSIVQF